VARHSFKPARCGYTLRVTSQASYSPEYITPAQQKLTFINVGVFAPFFEQFFRLFSQIAFEIYTILQK
jgi:hypothetical protein